MVPGLSPYYFGFDNPIRYSGPMGLMGQDAVIWGTGNAYASNASENPFSISTQEWIYRPGFGTSLVRWHRDSFHNWMSMDNETFNSLGYTFKYKWVDHEPYTAEDSEGTYVTAKRSEWVLYHAAQNGGMTDFSNSNHALNIGNGIYGAMGGLTSSQGYWLGNNGKYYSTNWGGNQYTRSRTGALKAANTYKLAGRAVVVGQVIIGGYSTYEGYVVDGGQFGYNAQRAAASSAGGIVFGVAGAEVGALLGATIGAAFGGVGVFPGAVIGGFGFGVGGSYLGSYLGESSVDNYHGR